MSEVEQAFADGVRAAGSKRVMCDTHPDRGAMSFAAWCRECYDELRRLESGFTLAEVKRIVNLTHATQGERGMTVDEAIAAVRNGRDQL